MNTSKVQHFRKKQSCFKLLSFCWPLKWIVYLTLKVSSPFSHTYAALNFIWIYIFCWTKAALDTHSSNRIIRKSNAVFSSILRYFFFCVQQMKNSNKTVASEWWVNGFCGETSLWLNCDPLLQSSLGRHDMHKHTHI